MVSADIASVMLIEESVHITPWTERIFLDCLAVGYSCWVIEQATVTGQANVISGFGVASIALDECHIFNVSIAENWQRRGLGKYLMEHLLSEALRHEVKRVFLEVRQSNIPALSLYQGLGFHVIATRKDYYRNPNGREDAFILEVLLP